MRQMNKFDSVILDADFCIKLGNYESESLAFIKFVVNSLCNKAYIHEYVYKNEILTPVNARKQLKDLIDNGKLEVLHEDNLDFLDKNVFEETKKLLKQRMIGTKEEGKNWGEVLSLSMAKTKNIPILMSDEWELQSIIDQVLNIDPESSNKIRVFRLKNLIEFIQCNSECNTNFL